MSRQPATIICDGVRMPAASQAGDFHDVSGHAHEKRGEIALAAPFLETRWSRAESAPMPNAKTFSGRSQRGDSAWYKTLDHLLSLLVEGLV
jgi:hypothetical protein